MKYFITLLMILSAMEGIAQNGKAVTTKKTFSRETAVSTEIKASPSIVWALLTDANDMARWNSTIVSLEGNIATGEKILLKSTLDPKRTFKLKVKEMQPETMMVWGDAQGKRTYTIDKIDDQTVRFTMSEKIGGPLFPLFAGMIPSFDESFETYAADLKKEAETIQNK